MSGILRLIRELFATPEAEADAEAWASRFLAHFGLAAMGFLGLVALTGAEWAAGIVCGVYALWEAAQWQGGRRMAFDGLLDWVAFALSACSIVQVWHQQSLAALAFALAATAILCVGVWRRE